MTQLYLRLEFTTCSRLYFILHRAAPNPVSSAFGHAAAWAVNTAVVSALLAFCCHRAFTFFSLLIYFKLNATRGSRKFYLLELLVSHKPEMKPMQWNFSYIAIVTRSQYFTRFTKSVSYLVKMNEKLDKTIHRYGCCNELLVI